MKKLLYILVAMFTGAMAWPTVGDAAVTSVKVRWDSTNVMEMGRTMPMIVEIVQDAGRDGRLVTANIDTLSAGVEIRKALPPDTVNLKNNRVQITQQLIVQAFDSGLYQLPPMVYLSGNDTILSNELTLKVIPVKVDTTGGITDFKPVLGIPHKWKDYIPNQVSRYWWLWLTAAILLALAVVAFILYRRYKKKGIVPWKSLKKRLPPYEEAIARLQQIERMQMWQQGKDKDYYTALTDVLRVYIERRFGINAVEMTTSQIMDECHEKSELIEPALLQRLQELLERADLVKFADSHPDSALNDEALSQARHFVEETKPQPQPQPDGQTTPEPGKEVKEQ